MDNKSLHNFTKQKVLESVGEKSIVGKDEAMITTSVPESVGSDIGSNDTTLIKALARIRRFLKLLCMIPLGIGIAISVIHVFRTVLPASLKLLRTFLITLFVEG